MQVTRAQLGKLTRLGEGGFGVVHEIAAHRLPRSLGGDLVFKEVKRSLSEADRREALATMAQATAFRDRLSPADQQDLDQYSVWPVAMVVDGAEPVGCVMPRLPAACYVNTPSKPVELNLSWLCAKSSATQRAGLDTSGFDEPEVRLAILTQLVYAVGRLHRHGRIYGDVSLKNVAFSLDPVNVYLMDCDGTADVADASRKQGHSPGFAPPECDANRSASPQTVQDEITDVYKLGLCIIRGMTKGRGATQASTPAHLAGVLAPATLEMLRRAVSADRAERPTAAELFRVLKADLEARIAPPQLLEASLSHLNALRGQAVDVRWQATGATGQRLTGPKGWTQDLPLDATHWSVPMQASGHIFLELSNRHGGAHFDLGRVEVHDLPPVSIALPAVPLEGLRLARPAVPRLPSVDLPAGLSAGPPRPVTSLSAHTVPHIPAPDVAQDVAKLSAARPRPLSFAGGVRTASLTAALRRTVQKSMTDLDNPLHPQRGHGIVDAFRHAVARRARANGSPGTDR